MSLQPTFDDLADVFVEHSIHEHPSALHGFVSALLVFNQKPKRVEFAAQLQQLFGLEAPLTDEAQLYFYRWLQAERSNIADPLLGFQLLLPDSDYKLNARMNALCLWAGNFVSAFGLLSGEQTLSDEVNEMLQDLALIAQAASDFGADENSDEDEDDWDTIAEHVRLTAVHLWLEFNEPPVAENVAPSVH